MYGLKDKLINAMLPFASLIIAISVTGCAIPQGTLFPRPQSPMVWPAPPSTPRIEWVGMLSNSDDLHAALPWNESFKSFFRGPRPPIRLTSPHGIAIHADGMVAVADTAGGAVHLIDLNSRDQKMITGFDQERFETPIGVAWAEDRLYVSDAGRHEIIELDRQGVFKHRFGQAELQRPVGIAFVASSNQLYVVDGDAHHIVVFDLDGNTVTTIGSRGVEPGTFNYPSHISVRDNRMLISDSGNFRVQLMNLTGKCLKTIGQKGNAAGDFALPKGVAFDSQGHIYVADARFENIQVFNQEGRLLMALGYEGIEPGRFSLPAGIAIDDQDRIWVAETGNKRLQVFAYIKDES